MGCSTYYIIVFKFLYTLVTPQIHHTFYNYDHIQRCRCGRQASLFNAVWYPDDAYNPYQL
jgi:hypothetical protein